MQRVPAKLGAVVTRGIDTLRPEAESQGLTLTLIAPAAPLLVRIDTGRMQQVVWNLVNNAVKFTPPGGRIEVRLERNGSMAELVVCDTGNGIPVELLTRVFDRFWQADTSTTRGSSGLGVGLAIVRELVAAQGGTVKAESAGEGRGSTFRVRVPLATAFYGLDLPPAA